MTIEIKKRLEYLRKEIENESISQLEIIELQGLSKYIDKSDILLLERAGVEEDNIDLPFFIWKPTKELLDNIKIQ